MGTFRGRIERTKRKLKKFVRKLELRRYGVLYLTPILIALVLALILIVAPKLKKHTGWIGVAVRQDATAGTLVIDDVVPNSPAHDVGMLPGDKILSYNGVAVSDVDTLRLLIHDCYINQLARIIIERNGRRLVADTRIAERPHR